MTKQTDISQLRGDCLLYRALGSRYCSREYRKLLRQFKMQFSMNRRGDCYERPY